MPHDQKHKVAGTTDPLSTIPESGKGRGESNGGMSLEVFGPSGVLIFAKYFRSNSNKAIRILHILEYWL